jgi:hypothetical protein
MNTEGEIAEAPVGSVMRRTAGLSNKAVRGYMNAVRIVKTIRGYLTLVWLPI